MAIAVHRAYLIRDDAILPANGVPRRFLFGEPDVCTLLAAAGPHPAGDGPGWYVEVRVRDKDAVRALPMTLERVLSSVEYRRSFETPLSFADLDQYREMQADLHWLWLYRNAFYVTERVPRPSELEEVVLRIKALDFDHDEKLKRLKEQVANYEAVETAARSPKGRDPIPDDVKLAVWTRDGGKCIRCGATKDLHFDHIIPHARGGGDHVENIQILCRTCNLSKSDRLA